MEPQGETFEIDTSKKPKNKLHLNLDYRIIIGVLLVAVGIMLALWRPWESAPTDQSKTITVSGVAKMNAVPDEYVFTPSYQFKNANKDAALAELTTKSNEIVAKLKGLGVSNDKIKTNSSGYNYSYYYDSLNKTSTYTLRLTITVNNKELAQKVQDYLITTSPIGTVSPEAQFSDKKQKELESQARDQATKDARAKADQMAKNLGFKVGKVKSVEDSGGAGDYPTPLYAAANSAEASDLKSTASLEVQPGENDFEYAVSVVYYIK